jgi:hypothetical protein
MKIFYLVFVFANFPKTQVYDLTIKNRIISLFGQNYAQNTLQANTTPFQRAQISED